MRRSRGALFLGAAVVACGAWLLFYTPRHSSVLRRQLELPAATLQRYAGDYELGGETYTLAVRAGRLFAGSRDHPQQPELELLPASPTQFFVRDMDGDLVATQDGHGRVTGFVFTQGRLSREVRKVR